MGSRAIPGLRYVDAHAAMAWLERVLGFERRLVVPTEDGGVAHAQLVLDDDIMVMLGSHRADAYGEHLVPPGDIGGRVTQAPYLVVPDLPAHYQRAVEAGATVVKPLEAQDYGGALYTVRDPEGHVWNVGSYDPWAPPDAAAA